MTKADRTPTKAKKASKELVVIDSSAIMPGLDQLGKFWPVFDPFGYTLDTRESLKRYLSSPGVVRLTQDQNRLPSQREYEAMSNDERRRREAAVLQLAVDQLVRQTLEQWSQSPTKKRGRPPKLFPVASSLAMAFEVARLMRTHNLPRSKVIGAVAEHFEVNQTTVLRACAQWDRNDEDATGADSNSTGMPVALYIAALQDARLL
jgi:hypothetical protein